MLFRSTSKVMLKILQARLQQYVNRELRDVQAGFRKGRGTRDKDQDNHNGVIMHLEPDILECEIKWDLGSITTNKASGGDRIPVELFQILKVDAVKGCTQHVNKCGKHSSGHRTGKGQFSFQSQRKAMPKNAHTTAHLHSSHTLVK